MAFENQSLKFYWNPVQNLGCVYHQCLWVVAIVCVMLIFLCMCSIVLLQYRKHTNNNNKVPSTLTFHKDRSKFQKILHNSLMYTDQENVESILGTTIGRIYRAIKI